MRTYSIEGSMNTPSVFIDESKHLIEICGNSTLKDTNWFYPNVLKWIIALNNGASKTQVINIKLNRINESSVKWLKIIIEKLSSLLPYADIEINWYINGNKNKILTSGQLIKDISSVKVNLI